VLIRFRAGNFRSLKDEQELSLVASSLKDSPEAVTPVEGLDLGLVRAAAIYGANASGKSNVVKALAYMSSAVQNSQRNWPPEGPIPREPFLLDPQSKVDPSSFEVDLLVDGIRYHYGFALNDKEILREWLDAYPIGRKQRWFKREGKAFTFGDKLSGDNSAIERLTRPNSLFLSAAAQNNHESLLPLYRWFAERFGFVARDRGPAIFNTAVMCKDEGFKSWASQILRSADMGIVDLHVQEEDLLPTLPAGLSTKEALLGEEFVTLLRGFAEKLRREVPQTPDIPTKRLVVSLIHKGFSRRNVPFNIENESDGTVAFYGLLGPLVHVLLSGGTLCVDELDASLHPLLALGVLSYFGDPELNPRSAQIIFTTHDTNILDRGALRRDQIWFTEKDSEGATHLYPLTDFKPRRNENLERGYLQGRYGAVPFIGSSDFVASAHEGEADH